MSFITPSSSCTAGACGTGGTSAAAITLKKFFFCGTMQTRKQPSAPHSCSSKRERTPTAAAATVKRTRSNSTQLQITDCLSFSALGSTSSSSSQGRSTPAGVAAPAASRRNTPTGPAQQHGTSKKPTGLLGTQSCSAGAEIENVPHELPAAKGREESEQQNQENECHAAEGRWVQTAATVTGAAKCMEEDVSKRLSDVAGPNTLPPAELPAALRDGAPGGVKDATSHEKGIKCSQHATDKAATCPSMLKGGQKEEDGRARCAGAPTAAVAGTERRETPTAAASRDAAPATPTAAEPTVAGPEHARAKAPARVAPSPTAAENASTAPVECSKIAQPRMLPIPESTPTLPPVDPEGEILSDKQQLERRWRDALGDSWFEELRSELALPYFAECLSFVRKERQKHRVFPPAHLVFNAFRMTPLDAIKAVIVGQDPYHQVGQAMGLAFSVPRGIPLPPSLQNIFKEISRNYPANGRSDTSARHVKTQNGDLSGWAKQGVFLMNTILSVRENSPLSHKPAGWERFTNKVVSIINSRCDGVVFLLWGKPAQKKSAALDRHRHFILEAGHPSPLSVRFFEGCQHFRKCNEYLLSKGKSQIFFRPCV